MSSRFPCLSENPFSVITIGMSPYSLFIHATVLLIAHAVIDSQLEPDLIKIYYN